MGMIKQKYLTSPKLIIKFLRVLKNKELKNHMINEFDEDKHPILH
jgi:hypothetical protein